MFENKIIGNYTYATRFIVSWLKAGGERDWRIGGSCYNWLRHLRIDGEALSEEEINRVLWIASNGKLELEDDARAWLSRH